MPRKPWTEADYAAAGVAQLKLRLKTDDVERLRTLAHDAGVGLSEWVTVAIDKAWKGRSRKKSTER